MSRNCSPSLIAPAIDPLIRRALIRHSICPNCGRSLFSCKSTLARRLCMALVRGYALDMQQRTGTLPTTKAVAYRFHINKRRAWDFTSQLTEAARG